MAPNGNGTLPTYSRDIAGHIKQWDERDIVFARQDLFLKYGVDSAEYRRYYAAHPEHLEYDARTAAMPGLGRDGGIDRAMFEAQFDAIRSVSADSFVDGVPAAERVAIAPGAVSAKIKGLARLLGADLVGIGPLRQEWVYSAIARSPNRQAWGQAIDLRHHDNAVALGFAMDRPLLECAPDFPTLLATAHGYADGAWVAIQLARYIRTLGYAARAHHLYNYQVLCVPVAVDCGLGELSRAGYLLNKKLGLGLRLAIVTTDMPFVHDAPADSGVQSFCETCKICAEECPSGAIPSGDKVVCNGIKKWKLDDEKCYRYWHAMGTDCGICMAACPWTKRDTWLHRTMAELAAHPGAHQSLLTAAHNLAYRSYRSGKPPAFMTDR